MRRLTKFLLVCGTGILLSASLSKPDYIVICHISVDFGAIPLTQYIPHRTTTHTLYVERSEVSEHMSHGDYFGECK
jgi:hypothetical protein